MAIESQEGFLAEPLITETQKIINAVGYHVLENDPENLVTNEMVCLFARVDQSLAFQGITRSPRRRVRTLQNYPRYHLLIDWSDLTLGRFPQIELHVDYSPHDILTGSNKNIKRELERISEVLEEMSGSYPAELVSDLKVAVQLRLAGLGTS